MTGNIAAGGMKGVTFVQGFQYWLKLCAIAIPAIILIILVGHGSMLNLAPDHSPAFARTTKVSIPENLQFTAVTLAQHAQVTVTGLLDRRRRRRTVRLRPAPIPSGPAQARLPGGCAGPGGSGDGA